MTFQIHDQTSRSAELSQAILLYSGSGHAYATIHPVRERDGRPEIRAGRPIDSESLRAVCANLVKSSLLRSGVLPWNVLSVGLAHVVWWRPPGESHVFFDCRGDGIGRRNGTIPLPGLVFAVKQKSMKVFAVKGRERPTQESPLFHAPLMNVWEGGNVCTGSMPLPESSVAESIASWEAAFWQSAFSHPNHPKPVRYKGGIHQISSDLLDGRFKVFPARALNPLPENKTVGDLTDHLDELKGWLR